jgi:hypothetical protein
MLIGRTLKESMFTSDLVLFFEVFHIQVHVEDQGVCNGPRENCGDEGVYPRRSSRVVRSRRTSTFPGLAYCEGILEFGSQGYSLKNVVDDANLTAANRETVVRFVVSTLLFRRPRCINGAQAMVQLNGMEKSKTQEGRGRVDAGWWNLQRLKRLSRCRVLI